MQFTQAVLVAVLVAAAVLEVRTHARAVAQEDVKGVRTGLQDEARDDPFFDPNPQYDYAYRIHDAETGDAKDASEQRVGDAVQGSYSVVDPDGTLRVVKYTADDINGFNAVVSLTPGHSKPYVPPIRQRAAVSHHHVDVPVPVKHHVVAPQTSAEILSNRRTVLGSDQASLQTVVHMMQLPLGAVGLQQVPVAPEAYQQFGTLLGVPLTAQGAQHIVQQVPQQVPIAQEQSIINQQEALNMIPQGAIQGVQKDIPGLKGIQNIQGVQGIQNIQGVQGIQNIQGVQEIQNIQGVQEIQNTQGAQGIQNIQGALGIQNIQGVQEIQDIQGVQGVQGIQNIQGALGIHNIQQSPSDQQQQQQQSFSQEQQDNKLQQQGIGGHIFPQVIEVRHSVQQMEPQQQQQGVQVRSLDSGEEQVVAPRQRTLAVYRSSFGSQGGNFITFNSPYAQYSIS